MSDVMRTSPAPPDVLTELLDRDTIAVVTLYDPDRGNAMSPEMGDLFRQAMDGLRAYPALRAVVLRGTGPDFSVGGPRDMLVQLGDEALSFEERRTFMLGFYDRWLSVLDVPVPVIAAIEGDCIGVAPVFACLSDICLVDERANFEITFTSLGLYPGMGLSYLLPRSLGPQRAALAMIDGHAFTGAQAAAMGLAARSVRPGTVHDEALVVARRIAGNAPDPVRLLTRTLRVTRDELHPVLEFEARQQAESYATAEFRQRIASYLSDRYERSPAPANVAGS